MTAEEIPGEAQVPAPFLPPLAVLFELVVQLAFSVLATAFVLGGFDGTAGEFDVLAEELAASLCPFCH